MNNLSELRIEIINDYAILNDVRKELRELLNACFPDQFEHREYFKQVPKFRYLVWNENDLVAQMGVEDRIINLDGTPARIMGVIDLCVVQSYRSHQIATNLLSRLEVLGKMFDLDFIILFADDHRLYKRNGYTLVNNTCRWLAIDEHRSIDVFEKRLPDCFMVKQLSEKRWKKGTADLLGYLF